jgi:hypothetical protein
MPKAYAREPLEPLASSDGERHAEFKRCRDTHVHMKVPIGGEAPYLAEGWTQSKKLKRQLRLSRKKASTDSLRTEFGVSFIVWATMT